MRMDEVARILAGSKTIIESFRLVDVDDHDLEVGQTIQFSSHTMGIDGLYTVTAIEPAGPRRIRVQIEPVRRKVARQNGPSEK